MRIARFLASCGVASRRACERAITEGRVTVNGRRVTELGAQVDPQRDRVTVDRRVVALPTRWTHLALNKPQGYVTTASDTRNRRTVMHLIPPGTHGGVRLFPVGRLDLDSEGLLILTNDGELANRLTHPRYQVPKVYRVAVEGSDVIASAARLRKGVELDDGRACPKQVTARRTGRREGILTVTMTEGRKREVRRMCAAVGLRVQALRRTRIGPVALGRLAPGKTREISEEELTALRSLVGLAGITPAGTSDAP